MDSTGNVSSMSEVSVFLPQADKHSAVSSMKIKNILRFIAGLLSECIGAYARPVRNTAFRGNISICLVYLLAIRFIS